MKRRNKQVAAVLALAVVVAVVLVIVLSNGSSANGGAGQRPSYSGTATVKRQNLVSTDTESGTLSYANPQTVYNRLSGTITWLPAVGQLIKPGHALFDIDNSPVLLMNGTRPAFRDLTASDSDGPDILELNRNLVDLGYDPDGVVVDDEWQAATTAGVEALQKAEGWDETGTLSLGEIVFLPGSQLIATLAGTVGSTGGGSEASLSDPSPHSEFVDDTTTTSTGTTTTGTSTDATGTTTGTGTTTTGTTTTANTGTATTLTKTPPKRSAGTSGSSSSKALARELATLKAELAAVKAELKASSKADKPSASGSNPSSSGSSGSGGSGTGGSGSGGSGSGGSGTSGSTTEILTTNSTQLVVTVDLNASLQSEATLGEKVSVEMPDGSTVGGKVTAVSSVAQSSDSGDDGSGGSGSGGSGGSGSSSATVPITITLDKRAKGAGLDQASVSVNFTQAKASNVLSIPVTALIATSGQKFAVQEAVAPYKLLPVTTGLFAAGDVQISGSGVYQGLEVTDSQG